MTTYDPCPLEREVTFDAVCLRKNLLLAQCNFTRGKHALRSSSLVSYITCTHSSQVLTNPVCGGGVSLQVTKNSPIVLHEGHGCVSSKIFHLNYGLLIIQFPDKIPMQPLIYNKPLSTLKLSRYLPSVATKIYFSVNSPTLILTMVHLGCS